MRRHLRIHKHTGVMRHWGATRRRLGMSYSRCNRSRCYFESVACIWLDDQLSRFVIRKISFRHITNRTTPFSHMIESLKRDKNTCSITRAIIKGCWNSDDPLWRVETSRAEEDWFSRSSRWRRRGPDLDWKASRRAASGNTASLHWMVVCDASFSSPKPCAPGRSSLWHTHPPMLSDPWIYG